MPYSAPTKDIAFLLKHIGKVNDLADTPLFQDVVSEDLTEAVVNEAGRFAGDILFPLNRSADQEGAKIVDRGVVTASGFKEAYQSYVESGWLSVAGSPEFGGQGMPGSLAFAVNEMVFSANMSFGLCPMLSNGAVEAIEAHGSDHLKETYLPKMISGEWTGTMNLTEPQAGSDVGALKSKAVPNPNGDGTYLIKGQKIFITFGDHDMAENIIHLVLARLPDAPAGTKGISLFLVPKFLLNDDGTPGERNDAYAIALEHKLGIHASPTCVMAYGEDSDGAIGYLIGEENRGMAAMFTMMNNARLNVGIQGVAIAEAAYQHALAFSQDRKQGRAPGTAATESDAIIVHPDVRRNLMLMKSLAEASRAICMLNAGELDRARALDDKDAAALAKARADFLTPISKGWSTDIGVEVASIGVQIHGGMGFIEETGAAQYLRDARILPIYEGTNGIQFIDLVMRKLPMADGGIADGFFGEIAEVADALANHADQRLAETAPNLTAALAAAREATAHIQERAKQNPDEVLAGATAYGTLMGQLFGGWLLAKKALIADAEGADQHGDAFVAARIETALFFAGQILPQVSAGAAAVKGATGGLFALDAIALGA